MMTLRPETGILFPFRGKPSGYPGGKRAAKECSVMIRHVVMWKFKDEAEGRTRPENCAYIKKMLEALPPYIPFVRRLEVGVNEFSSPMAADMVLLTEFDSKDDLDLYAGHPEHVKVSDYVAKVRESRSVVDYTL
jgi:hypothetical protein